MLHKRNYIRLFLQSVGVLSFSLSLFSCNDERAIASVEYEPKIVVEGWIENGTPAQVILSWTTPFKQEMDTSYLLNQVIKSAKVSVSDGKETEVLTLGTNGNYLPPYAYYGSSLRGEIGKTYQLQIEYHDKILSAETTIPQPVALDKYWFSTIAPADTSGYIHIQFKNEPNTFYQAATRINGREKVFTPCLYGNFSSNQFGDNETVEMQLQKGPILYPKMNFETAFKSGFVIFLKFRTQTQESYDFWTSWQNEVLNAQNPIFPANTSLKSNIKGGIGSWCGYGTSNYVLITF